MVSLDTKEMLVSPHMVIRTQQRGVRQETVELVAKYGTRARVKGGRFSRMISASQAKKLIEVGLVAPSALDKANGVLIITDETPGRMVVLTVYPRNSKKWYRRSA